MLFILGLFLIVAGIYLLTIMRTVITGYREIPTVPFNLTQGYIKQAILAQTQPYLTIGVTISILGALLIAIFLIEITEKSN